MAIEDTRLQPETELHSLGSDDELCRGSALLYSKVVRPKFKKKIGLLIANQSALGLRPHAPTYPGDRSRSTSKTEVQPPLNSRNSRVLVIDN